MNKWNTLSQRKTNKQLGALDGDSFLVCSLNQVTIVGSILYICCHCSQKGSKTAR